MAAEKKNRYDEDFKKSLVTLYHNGKTQTQLCKEYGVSQSALGKWIKQYSIVEIDDGEVLGILSPVSSVYLHLLHLHSLRHIYILC